MDQGLEQTKKEAPVTQHSRSLQAPWLSHYEPGVPATLDYDETCLPAFLKQTAARHPERMALVF
jgi:hypothetical protein